MICAISEENIEGFQFVEGGVTSETYNAFFI